MEVRSHIITKTRSTPPFQCSTSRRHCFAPILKICLQYCHLRCSDAMSTVADDVDQEEECGWVSGWGISVAIFAALPLVFSMMDRYRLFHWLKIPVHKKAYRNWCDNIMKCTFSEDNSIAYGTKTCLPIILHPDNYREPTRSRGNYRSVKPVDENGHYISFDAPPEFKTHLNSNNLYSGSRIFYIFDTDRQHMVYYLIF